LSWERGAESMESGARSVQHESRRGVSRTGEATAAKLSKFMTAQPAKTFDQDTRRGPGVET
jgi:hypothetical protein